MVPESPHPPPWGLDSLFGDPVEEARDVGSTPSGEDSRFQSRVLPTGSAPIGPAPQGAPPTSPDAPPLGGGRAGRSGAWGSRGERLAQDPPERAQALQQAHGPGEDTSGRDAA